MTTRRTAIAALTATLLLGLPPAGIAASETPPAAQTAAAAPGEPFKRTELYFGGLRPDGSVITPAEFELFLDKEVTPAFPDGLTWLEAHGQWMGGKESSYLLIILYPLDDRDASQDLEEIRADYKIQFGQQSVLRADSVERVSF